MSETVVLHQLYTPLWGAVSVDHSRSPFSGPPSEWDLLGTDALLTTRKGEKMLIGERVRKKKFEHYGDVTVRWRSSMTGNALETLSLNCQYFIYACVDEDKKALLTWWILYPNKLLEGIRSGALKAEEIPNAEEGSSTFKAFKPKNLEQEGCVYRHGKGPYELPQPPKPLQPKPPKPLQLTLGF